MKTVRYLLCVSAIVILSGCATTTHLRTDLQFAPSPAKLDKTVLLEVPQQTRDYVAQAKYGLETFYIPVGQAVEPNAFAAFSSVVKEVTIERGGASPDRTIEVAIAPGTDIQLGTFTFSGNTFKIVLKCDVKAPDGKVVGSDAASAESSKRKAAGFLGGIWGYSAYATVLRDAADDALQQALQKLTEDIYKAKAQAL
jgi:hypothetical protein